MASTTTPLPQLIYPRAIHLRRRLKDLVYRPVDGARATIRVGPARPRDAYATWEEAVADDDAGRYEPISVGESFSPASAEVRDGVREFPWTQRWFRVDLEVPVDALGEDECCLYFLAHGEFTVYTSGGDVWCGIDPIHDRIPISSLLRDGQTSATIWLDGGEWIVYCRSLHVTCTHLIEH